MRRREPLNEAGVPARLHHPPSWMLSRGGGDARPIPEGESREVRMTRTLLKPRSALRAPRSAARPIGLLAGSGRFPILFAEAARRQGLSVACVGVKYEASEELRSLCDAFAVVGVSKLGRMIRTFRRM